MKRLMCFALLLLSASAQTERFDSEVREDFFAGYAGDTARFEHAMAKCEEALAKDPKNPAALVWHGGGLLYLSGQKYRAGDSAKGLELNQRGMKEMNDGVALAPENLQTVVARGAILIATARFIDLPMAKQYLETGAADYETALKIEQPNWQQRSVHGRGELLGGLADAYRRLGDRAKSREYLDRITRELPNSVYDKQAKRWLSDLDAVGKQERFCLGCHTSK